MSLESPVVDDGVKNENLFFRSVKSRQGNEKVATLHPEPEDSRKHDNCLAPGQMTSWWSFLGLLPEDDVRIRFVPALRPDDDCWATPSTLLHEARRETKACRTWVESSCCLGPMVEG